MSVVPVPDYTETQYMCPREFPLFPVFQRFLQYNGFRNMCFMFPVSEIVFTVSEIYVRFP
jgi:hypothetical protein